MRCFGGGEPPGTPQIANSKKIAPGPGQCSERCAECNGRGARGVPDFEKYCRGSTRPACSKGGDASIFVPSLSPPRFPINPPTTSSLSLVCNTQPALKVVGVCAGAACCCCSCSDGAGAAAAVLLLALHPRLRALGIATWPLPGCETSLRNLRTGLSPPEQQKAPKPAPARSACAAASRSPGRLMAASPPLSVLNVWR
jgi:hypothetical protein